MENYIIKKGIDSYFNDCGYYPNKTIDELIEIANNIEECVGFNNKGYMKKLILPDNKLVKVGHIDLYINITKINNIINDKKQIALGYIKKDITFVITTCKRLKDFKNTMDKFLYHCQDVYLISKWICIDDNSSEEDRNEMKRLYPFFKFIFKTEEQKGHAKSLNILLDTVKSKYVLMFEDDWECSMNFFIEPYVKLLNENIYHQVLFHSIINDEETFKYIRTANDIGIYEYQYSSICPYKYKLQGNYLKRKLEIEKEFNIISEVKGFHHPSFSLNVSIFNFSKIKSYNIRFKEKVEDNDIFELYFSFECLKKGFKVAFTKIHIEHSGWGNSAYILNDMKRSYEVEGTPYIKKKT
jgi:hypothetical protein